MGVNEIPLSAVGMSETAPNACGTSADGGAYCARPTVMADKTQTMTLDVVNDSAFMLNTPSVQVRRKRSLHSVAMFGVACLTSPCCTPLYVPLLLGLAAGTPLAAWLGHNLGWVYGGLTLISVISFVLALRRTSFLRSSR